MRYLIFTTCLLLCLTNAFAQLTAKDMLDKIKCADVTRYAEYFESKGLAKYEKLNNRNPVEYAFVSFANHFTLKVSHDKTINQMVINENEKALYTGFLNGFVAEGFKADTNFYQGQLVYYSAAAHPGIQLQTEVDTLGEFPRYKITLLYSTGGKRKPNKIHKPKKKRELTYPLVQEVTATDLLTQIAETNKSKRKAFFNSKGFNFYLKYKEKDMGAMYYSRVIDITKVRFYNFSNDDCTETVRWYTASKEIMDKSLQQFVDLGFTENKDSNKFHRYFVSKANPSTMLLVSMSHSIHYGYSYSMSLKANMPCK